MDAKELRKKIADAGGVTKLEPSEHRELKIRKYDDGIEEWYYDEKEKE